MRTTPRSAAFARRAGRLLIGILTATCAGVALAQISEYNEPPTSVHQHAVMKPTAAEAIETPPEDDSDLENPARPGSSAHAQFLYTMRPGDSLSAIAAMFGLDVQELARANHLSVDSVLLSGKTLKIPNPFLERVRRLTAQIDELKKAVAKATNKAAAAALKSRSSYEKIESLTANNKELRRETVELPRWRETAATFGIIALLTLGATMVMLFEWWLLRRRFAIQIAITDSLTGLDQKYKHLLAKAELRFQKLYGQKRPVGADTFEHGKTTNETEIEGLDRELHKALQKQLRSLGVTRFNRPRRNGLWRRILGDLEPPIDARSARR
jgi:LysM repeat protein